MSVFFQNLTFQLRYYTVTRCPISGMTFGTNSADDPSGSGVTYSTPVDAGSVPMNTVATVQCDANARVGALKEKSSYDVICEDDTDWSAPEDCEIGEIFETLENNRRYLFQSATSSP